MDSSGIDTDSNIHLYDYWAFERAGPSGSESKQRNKDASAKNKSQSTGGPAYPLRSKVGCVYYYEVKLESNIPHEEKVETSGLGEEKGLCFGIGSSRLVQSQDKTKQQNGIYACRINDEVAKVVPSNESKTISSEKGDMFRCEFHVDEATVVFTRNGSAMFSQTITENCYEVEFVPVIGTGDASIIVKMENCGIFYKKLAESPPKQKFDDDFLCPDNIASVKARFNALRVKEYNDDDEEFYVALFNRLRSFSNPVKSADELESEHAIRSVLLSGAEKLKNLFEIYDSFFQTAQEIVSKSHPEDNPSLSQGSSFAKRISSSAPVELSSELEEAIEKRTVAEANLLRVSNALKSKYATNIQLIANRIKTLQEWNSSFSGMPVLPKELDLDDGSYNKFQSTCEDFINAQISSAIVSIEDWQHPQCGDPRSTTDKALSNLWSALSDMSTDAAHMNSEWDAVFKAIGEEETWNTEVRQNSPLPTDVKISAFQIKHAIEEEIKMHEEAVSVVQRAFKRYSDEARPQKPKEIEKLMRLEADSRKARRNLMFAQVTLRTAILDGVSPEDLEADKQDVEKCILKYRAVCKEVEKELSVLVNLTATDFPELPLLFPQADLLRINQISKEGLLKFGVFFNPSNQDQMHDGCYRNAKRIHYGRHAVFTTELDDRECVLKEYNLRQNSDSRRLVREVLMLNKLNHQGIVKIEGVVMGENASTAYVQMPFFPGGNMKEWLDRKQRSKDEIRAILHEVASSVEYLHINNVVHSDIKLENVFMSSDESFASPTLGDFDISKEDENSFQATSTTVVGGTSIYLAPERLHGGRASRKSDIFALGLTMFLASVPNRTQMSDVLFKQSPVERYNSLMAMVKSMDDHYGRCGLILWMLQESPDSRPTAAEINASEYLNFSGSKLEFARLKEEEDKKRKLEEELNPERSCSICLLDKREMEGIVCSNVEMRTFVCDSCFQEYVSEQSQIENIEILAKHDGKIGCPTRKYGCPDTCFFPDSSIAQHVPEKVFEIFSSAKKAVLERTLRKAVQDEERLKYEQQLAKLQELTEHQRLVFLARKKIEDMLNMRCPVETCKAVFEDIEEDHCMALRCRSCSTAFCAWCLKNCKDDGNDAHGHVMGCTFKPKGSTYWDTSPGRRDWRRVTRDRQWSQISKELKILDRNILEGVLSAVVPLFRQREMVEMLRMECNSVRDWKPIVDRAIQGSTGLM